MEITFDRKNVSTCLQQRFALPTYQRDYRWEPKHLQELLSDIQEVFLDNYSSEHGRTDVSTYGPYFLGTIITTGTSTGHRAIVDGQQRLTTLTALILYFLKIKARNPDLSISDIEPLIKRDVFGQSQFNIEFDEDRKRLLSTILSTPLDSEESDIDELVDSIPGITSGTRRLYEVFSEIQNSIVDAIDIKLIPYLIDYIIERVYLFEIGVPSEQDGHKVFVTMNDRGLRLSPIDLLKGHFLSKISNDEMNRTAHEAWVKSIKLLNDIGADEDSSFFKTWLRGKYAASMRGKSRGDTPGDFDQIGDAYHRWVVTNESVIGLNNSDDYYNIVTQHIPHFAHIYRRIKEYEKSYHKDFRYVFYNGKKDITLQSMIIMSSINVDDSNTDVDKKIKIVSCFLDYYTTVRTMNNKSNTYDNLKQYIFQISRKIRSKPILNMVDILSEEIGALDDGIDITKFSYYFYARPALLHILARIAEFMEEGSQQTNSVGFDVYVDRRRGAKTFDIEHVLSYNEVKNRLDLAAAGEDDFSSDSEYSSYRNKFASLILLPRGRNRSLQAGTYSEKRPKYASENILAQTLTADFYENNPTLLGFISDENIDIGPIEHFNKAAVDRREAMYMAVARRIWSVDKLSALAK